MVISKPWSDWCKLIRHVPSESGIYCVWSKSKPLYIGTSRNLSKRLLRHRMKYLFLSREADMVTFVVFPSSGNRLVDTRNRYCAERWFIMTHNPPLNVRCVVS